MRSFKRPLEGERKKKNFGVNVKGDANMVRTCGAIWTQGRNTLNIYPKGQDKVYISLWSQSCRVRSLLSKYYEWIYHTSLYSKPFNGLYGDNRYVGYHDDNLRYQGMHHIRCIQGGFCSDHVTPGRRGGCSFLLSFKETPENRN